MASNRFFTIMVVPEKSNRVRKLVIPGYVFKGAVLSGGFIAVLAAIMVLDYANVMNQINENKQLKVENRQLRQSVQVFKTKMVTIENTLDRVKTFATKLRIISNIEDTGGASPPPAAAPVSAPPASAPVIPAPGGSSHSQLMQRQLEPDTDLMPTHPFSAGAAPTPAAPAAEPAADPYEASRSKRLLLLAALVGETTESFSLSDADNSLFVRTEFEKLDAAYDEINRFALSTEQETQDILEKLGDKRIQLASTPTRIPTLGYITSDYGVRISPYDNRRKIHEGIDIANRYGADVIAPADGEVTFSGVKPGYGKLVVLDHGNGIETRYAHNSRVYVASGARVHRGQRIAAVGNTGHSTGPHCHYEVHVRGLPVNPCAYILDQPTACRQR